MRELKFRAWDEADGLHRDKGEMSYGITDISCDATVIMQYTGLKDKNKKEIYEGDIINAYHVEDEEYCTTPVVFRNGAFSIGRYWKDGIHDWYSMEQYDSYDMEIIGNIYENPELLKQNHE